MENEVQPIEQTPEVEPHGAEQGSAPEPDWKTTSRKWEGRAKENKEEADGLRAENATLQADLAEVTKRAEEAEAKAAQLEAAAARERAINAIAAETGVSAAVLGRMTGETEDEIRANAQVVRSTMPVYPTTRETGRGNAPAVTKESILQIKNERERLKAIAEHADLF